MKDDEKNNKKLMDPNITNLLQEKEKVFIEPIKTWLQVIYFTILLRVSSETLLLLS